MLTRIIRRVNKRFWDESRRFCIKVEFGSPYRFRKYSGADLGIEIHRTVDFRPNTTAICKIAGKFTKRSSST